MVYLQRDDEDSAFSKYKKYFNSLLKHLKNVLKINKPVKIEITAKPSGFDEKPCSVLINFPDGSKKYLLSNNPDFTVRTEFTPKSEGLMSISWVGESSLDGKPVVAVDGAVKQVFGN